MSIVGDVNGAVAESGTQLHILALKAAREIDRALRGKSYSEEDLTEFFARLKDGTSVTSSIDKVKSLAPSDIDVMRRAALAYGGSEPSTLKDIADTLDKVLGDLEETCKLDQLDSDHLRV